MWSHVRFPVLLRLELLVTCEIACSYDFWLLIPITLRLLLFHLSDVWRITHMALFLNMIPFCFPIICYLPTCLFYPITLLLLHFCLFELLLNSCGFISYHDAFLVIKLIAYSWWFFYAIYMLQKQCIFVLSVAVVNLGKVLFKGLAYKLIYGKCLFFLACWRHW